LGTLVFDSELSQKGTALAAERLIAVIGGAGSINDERIEGRGDIREGNRGREMEKLSRRGKERDTDAGNIPEVVEARVEGESSEGGEIEIDENAVGEAGLVNLSQQSALSEREYVSGERAEEMKEHEKEGREEEGWMEEGAEIGRVRGRGNIQEVIGEEEEREYREGRGRTRIPESRNNQTLSSSAIRSRQKRRLPHPWEEEVD